MFKLEDIETLQIELTNQCNAACPACAREIKGFNFNSKLDRAEISLDQFKNYFSKSFLRKIKEISFAGNFGDPIMAKDVYEIVQYIKQSNPLLSISINTNGSTRNTDWWTRLGKLMQYSKDIVVWSIDGLEDTNHLYRINTNWDKIIKNVKAFISAGGHAHWAMLVFDYNEHQVNDCINLAKKMGFEEFISKQSPRHIVKLYNDAFPRQPKNYTYELTKDNNITCAALLDKSIYISAYGTVLPCCNYGDRHYLNDFSVSHPGLITKNKFNIETLKNTIDSFNNIVETWHTNTPVDVCKNSCSFNYNKDVSAYRFTEKEITNHIVFQQPKSQF